MNEAKKSVGVLSLTTLLLLVIIGICMDAEPLIAQADSVVTPQGGYGNLDQYEWLAPIGGNAERTGFSAGPGPDRPTVLWRHDQSAPEIGTLTGGMQLVFDGKCFVISVKAGQTYICALDAFTGRMVWMSTPPPGFRFNIGRSASSSGSAVFRCDETHVFAPVAGNYSGIAMFDAQDGSFLWVAPINPSAAYHRNVISEDMQLLFGPWTPQGEYGPVMSAWDMSNPDSPFPEVWRYPMDAVGNPVLCYGDRKLFCGSYSSFVVYALNAETGELLWETPRKDYCGYAGAYEDGKLYCGCAGMYLTCYDADSGELLWTGEETGAIYRGFMVWSGNVAYGRTYWHNLGAGTSGFTGCWDTDNGRILWKAPTYYYIGYYQTVMADGKIYGMQSDGTTTTGREATPVKFVCWDAFTGQEIWSLVNVTFNNPGIAYGNLYATDLSTTYPADAGILYCYSTVNAPEYIPQDWSMWRGNVEDPGVTPNKGPTNIAPGPKWTYQTDAAVTSSPVVSNGKLFVGSQDGNLYCLDAYTGSLYWKFPIGSRYYSTPAVVGNRVIIGPDDGYIYCIDVNSGTQLWRVDAGGYVRYSYGLGQWQPRSSPIIYNDRIYVGSLDGKFRCLDTSGNVVWTYDSGTPIVGSAAIENNVVYFLVASRSNQLRELNLNGELIRNFTIITAQSRPSSGFTFGLDSGQTPVVVGNRVYIGVNTAFLLCYDATTGEVLINEEQPNVLGENAPVSPVYVPDSEGGRIYVPAGPTEACANATSGENIWSAWGGWEVFSSSCYAGTNAVNAHVYGGSQSYSITCWNASDGAPISWYTTGGQVESSPCVYDGRLYVGSADWNIYCFYDDRTVEMSMSASADKASLRVGEPVTITAQLNPGLPSVPLKAVFTSPSGTTVERTANSDNKGLATISYSPDAQGTWRFVAQYEGDSFTGVDYSSASSEEQTLSVAATTTQPPTSSPTNGATGSPTQTPTDSAEPGIPAIYLYGAIAIIVIIIAIFGIVLIRRRR